MRNERMMAGECQIGDRVRVKPGMAHDAETASVDGTVVLMGTCALGIEFDGMDAVHKWYVEDELEPATSEAPGEMKQKSITLRRSMSTRNDPQVLERLRSRATPDGLLQVQERDGRTYVRGLGAGHTRAGTVNPETFTIDAMVSTNELDRYETIIEPDGWDLENYLRNPVVFFNHEDRETPIGKCISIAKMSNGLLARTLFAASMADCPDDAKEVWIMNRGGFLGAWSVSFWPRQWEGFQLEQPTGEVIHGIRFLEQELLEYSSVGIPGAPGALSLGLARVALASAKRFGRAIPESRLAGDLGLISRAAQLVAGSDDLAHELMEPEDEAMKARVAALKESVRRLSPQPNAEPAGVALAQALADMKAAGALLVSAR